MSLVGSQVYANSSKSCWVSVNGGDVINGSLEVNGNLQVDGNLGVAGTARAGLTITSLGGDVEASGALKGQSVVLTTPLGVGTNGTIYTNGTTPTQVSFTGAGFNFRPTAIDPVSTSLALGIPTTNTDSLVVGGSVSMNKLLATGGNMVGTGSITVGNSSTGISTANVTANSKIFLSRIGPASAGPAKGAAQGILTYDPADILPGLSFTVRLVDIDGVTTTATDVNAQFIWMVVN